MDIVWNAGKAASAKRVADVESVAGARRVAGARHVTGMKLTADARRASEAMSACLARWGEAPALAFHRSLDGYAATPLVALSGLASDLGLARIWVKDESFRFGLNAFKGLGCSYAMASYLCERAGIPVDEHATRRLRSPGVARRTGRYTFVTATDGNHGRGVAWAARMLGHEAVVYLPEGASPERVENIRALGAQASILPLNYDDAVRAAAKAATENGWVLVQDTAWEGYEELPLRIMEGYATLACEIEQQLANAGEQVPTHLFLQAGVGSMAGAVLGYFVQRWGEACPVTVIVEPDQANCCFLTARANDGRLHRVAGRMDSMMAGLCCGEPNPLGWEVLSRHVSAFVSCSDELAARGMRILGRPHLGDTAVVSGESGAVTTGVLVRLMRNPQYADWREKLGLGEDSRVLLISTEGDTDQENYRRVMGLS